MSGREQPECVATPEWVIQDGDSLSLVVHRCGGYLNAYSLKCSGCGAAMSEEEFERLTEPRMPVWN